MYQRRLREAGASVDSTWVEDGKFTEEGGAAAAEKLLTRHPDLTAMLAVNDKMAIGVMLPLSAIYAEMELSVQTLLKAEGVAQADISITREIEMCYVGQSFRLKMPVPNQIVIAVCVIIATKPPAK